MERTPADTSHLKRYYKHCKTKTNIDIRNYMQLGRYEIGNLTTFFCDEKCICREEMVDYITKTQQPLNLMETHDFL